MRTKILLLILVIGMVLLGACASPPAAPATSPAPSEILTPNLTPIPQETPAPPPITYTITVTAAPSNGGSVNLSPAGGTYTSDTTVTLIATPVSGYTLDYWDGAASGSSYTVTIIMNSNKSTTAHFKAAPAPTTTPTPPPTPTGPYTGPLFDTHLHLSSSYINDSTGQLSRLRSAADLLSYLDRNKVEGAIGFYYFLPNKSSRTNSSAETIIMGARSRVIPLLQPEGNSWTQFASGQYNEAVLRQYLQPQGLLQGVGEIGLYHEPLQSVTFDSPVIQTVFQVVNELKGIVMIQPSDALRGRPTDLAEIEPSIAKYPDAIFLFHGHDIFNLVVPLMAKYPNVYYTMDAMNWIFYSRNNILSGADAANNAESFLTEINQIGVFDGLLEKGFAYVAPLLQQYPDRIMWGTDLSQSWHFEEPVTDMVIKISRQLIGKLPADIQEKYAYQNAQRIFGRFLTPNP